MDLYSWIKAAHVISVISWMAALLYLPRLYVYHVDAEHGSVQSETFKVMERRLLKAIATPAMLASWAFGVLLALPVVGPGVWGEGWFLGKFVLVVAMTGFHGALASWRKDFLNDANRRTTRFYRFANEVPTVLMVLIVILVIVRPG
jgi:putative membrane protein